MIIGIDGSRAFLEKRTGIEEYSFQTIKHLAKELKDVEVRLYLRNGQRASFVLPENWKVKNIWWPKLWTQAGLSLEMLFHPVDVLFIPAHVVPIIHPARNASHSDAGGPKKTVVVVHGLEFEFIPKAYSFWARMYMRWSIRSSCRWAKKIIAVSENTKRDLMKLYKVPEEKIEVVYEGIPTNYKSNTNIQIKNDTKYLLFLGRLEERKNIIGIIKAFEILKEKYNIPHKLILAGKPGYGYEKIKNKIQESKFRKEILEKGYVSEEEKQELLKNAEVFLFPTFYEGFGLPILEAQAEGVPVVASSNSSIPEVAEDSAILINPKKPEEIAEAVWKIISNENLRQELIDKGLKNVERFSWEKCGEKIAEVLLEK
jgi:glycosyltransferase involved in cell wall biosynthesis